MLDWKEQYFDRQSPFTYTLYNSFIYSVWDDYLSKMDLGK